MSLITAIEPLEVSVALFRSLAVACPVTVRKGAATPNLRCPQLELRFAFGDSEAAE